MGIKRLLYFPYSEIVLAVILGFGLATLFRKSCGNKSCIEYRGPDLEEIKKTRITLTELLQICAETHQMQQTRAKKSSTLHRNHVPHSLNIDL